MNEIKEPKYLKYVVNVINPYLSTIMYYVSISLSE